MNAEWACSVSLDVPEKSIVGAHPALAFASCAGLGSAPPHWPQSLICKMTANGPPKFPDSTCLSMGLFIDLLTYSWEKEKG